MEQCKQREEHVQRPRGSRREQQGQCGQHTVSETEGSRRKVSRGDGTDHDGDMKALEKSSDGIFNAVRDF